MLKNGRLHFKAVFSRSKRFYVFLMYFSLAFKNAVQVNLKPRFFSGSNVSPDPGETLFFSLYSQGFYGLHIFQMEISGFQAFSGPQICTFFRLPGWLIVAEIFRRICHSRQAFFESVEFVVFLSKSPAFGNFSHSRSVRKSLAFLYIFHDKFFLFLPCSSLHAPGCPRFLSPLVIHAPGCPSFLRQLRVFGLYLFNVTLLDSTVIRRQHIFLFIRIAEIILSEEYS